MSPRLSSSCWLEKAGTWSAALHIVTPPPTDANHAEVMAGLWERGWQ